MELDGYCEKLNLALEYHGKQHYEDIKFFRKKGKEYLKKRLLDDRTKSKICKKKGIVLIEVPYTVKFEEMKG